MSKRIIWPPLLILEIFSLWKKIGNPTLPKCLICTNVRILIIAWLPWYSGYIPKTTKMVNVNYDTINRISLTVVCNLWRAICSFYSSIYLKIPSFQFVICRNHAWDGTGCERVFKYSIVVFFCAPRCHLTDGCHLTHTGAIIQLNDFIQGFVMHPRCHLSDGCDAELVNTTQGLTRERCCRQ